MVHHSRNLHILISALCFCFVSFSSSFNGRAEEPILLGRRSRMGLKVFTSSQTPVHVKIQEELSGTWQRRKKGEMEKIIGFFKDKNQQPCFRKKESWGDMTPIFLLSKLIYVFLVLLHFFIKQHCWNTPLSLFWAVLFLLRGSESCSAALLHRCGVVLPSWKSQNLGSPQFVNQTMFTVTSWFGLVTNFCPGPHLVPLAHLLCWKKKIKSCSSHFNLLFGYLFKEVS